MIWGRLNDDGVTVRASKTRRRKRRYMTNWYTRRKENRTLLNRKERRKVKEDLEG